MIHYFTQTKNQRGVLLFGLNQVGVKPVFELSIMMTNTKLPFAFDFTRRSIKIFNIKVSCNDNVCFIISSSYTVTLYAEKCNTLARIRRFDAKCHLPLRRLDSHEHLCFRTIVTRIILLMKHNIAINEATS